MNYAAMPVDFISTEGKIELNQESIKTYKEGVDKAADRISFISIIYSVLSIYLVQFVRFMIVHRFQNIVFVTFLGLLVICIFISVAWTVRFLLPVRIAHVHQPQYFYKHIRKKYKEKGVEEDRMQDRIQATYLNELEKAVTINFAAYKSRRRNFYYAFNFALVALIPYLVCAAIMLGTKEKEEPQKIELTNTDALVKKIDSLISKKN